MDVIMLHNATGGWVACPATGAHSECPCRVVSLHGGITPTEQPLLGLLLQLKPASALQFRRPPRWKSLEKATRPVL
jgi:hypothetical protein